MINLQLFCTWLTSVPRHLTATCKTADNRLSNHRRDGVRRDRGQDERHSRWPNSRHLDVDTGQTKLTWRCRDRYAYHWGDVVAMYRYLDWNAESGKPIENLNLGGRMSGVTFRW